MRPQPAQDGRQGEGAVQFGRHAAGEDDLVQRGVRGPHDGDGAGDHVLVLRPGEVRRERRDGDVPAGGRLGPGAVLPYDGVEQLLGRRQGQVGRADRGGPAMGGAVGLLGDAHGEAGDDEMALAGVEEGERPQRHHARARALHGVVTGDGGQDALRLVRLHQQRGTPSDQREPGAVEQNRGAAVELERIGPVLEGDGAGVQAGVAHRGAGAPGSSGVDELAQPSRQGADADTGVAGLGQHAAEHRRRRQIGDRTRQVVVGVAVGQGGPDAGDHAGEPDVVAGAQDRGRGGIDLQQGQPAPRAEHPRRLGQRGRQVGEVAEGVPAHEAVEDPVAEGEPAAVGLQEGGSGVVGVQHAPAQVGPDHPVVPVSGQPGQITGAAGHIEQERSLGQGERGDGLAPPRLVEPEGHQPVDQVVTGRDGVEHGADAGRLLLALGKRLGRHAQLK